MCGIEKKLLEIRNRLKDDEFANEQAISHGIVMPVLQELGWDVFDTKMVWPEYNAGKGRVDFALCDPPGNNPKCFIEVKQPGKAETRAVEQLMSYAFICGAPSAILTDGQTWSFFLPAEAGTFEERRVFFLDLFEHESVKAAEILAKYMLKSDVITGAAHRAAQKEHGNKSRLKKAKAGISDAWNDLLRSRDDRLIELLAAEVESKVGYRPDINDIVDFLMDAGFRGSRVAKQEPATTRPPRRLPPASVSKVKVIEVILFENASQFTTMSDAMIHVFKTLADRDSALLDRCSVAEGFIGRKRPKLARDFNEMSPNPNLTRANQVRELPGGWLIWMNTSNRQKIAMLERICKVAGIRWEYDLKIFQKSD
ncbi:MAG: hypothetical protein OXC62_03075 [Aestuariivita sp.]|nr:hypothetical protein [Aestuariivita sp.]